MAYKKGNPRHAKAAAAEPEKAVQSGNPRRASKERRRASARAEAPVSSAESAPDTEDAQTTADRFSARTRREALAFAELRKKRKRKRILLGVLSGVLVLALGAGAFAFAFISNIDRNLRSGVDDNLLALLATTDTPEDPFYALLLGIDGSLEREETMGANFRSDSMILARIDPRSNQVALVSIPRDLQMDDLDGHGQQKINAAHAFGGPALTVKTVSELAGVPISHYAEINFDGFQSAVDALGGVEVDVPIQIDDPEAGGHLDAGTQTLSGSQALILCRSRHSYDDYGSGDDYRAANQRMVISAIAQKLLASDPVTLSNTISAMSEYVLTDMSVAEIVAIAQSMAGMTADDIYSAKAPSTSEYTDGIWWDILDEKEWKAMMKRVDAGQPPVEEEVIDPLTGTIMSTAGQGAYSNSLNSVHAANRSASIGLRNGNGSDGICAAAEDILEEMGYSKINARNADNFDYDKTVIVYKTTSDKADAELIAQALGVGEVMPDRDVYLFDEDVLIVLGSDYHG
ncbi:LCP family protein [Adlercreutzia murintestinalis]|uniref:LCP family protein n=1 Tax=Adlercreutzia murintestinalis TaxID=2941325 RepID=UPI00203FD112|nr:LCP family protein [Adlercreutzia murintestinalis]